jgi:hypothetical protein
MSVTIKTGLTLEEAAEQYAETRATLPPAGEEFRGPEDARNFQACQEALFELQRAALRSAKGVV